MCSHLKNWNIRRIVGPHEIILIKKKDEYVQHTRLLIYNRR